VAKTLFLTHSDCQKHNAGPNHPEKPERLDAVLEALDFPQFSKLLREDAPNCDRSTLKLVHTSELVDNIFNHIPTEGYVAIEGDTIISPDSGEAALRAVGAVCAAIDNVIAGQVQNAFCAVRPPGHHAEAGRSMGFCLFNNICIGAEFARRKYGIGRIAIVDFDVHHGNGTQAIFENDGDIFFGSTHQSPLYPGTGAADEKGVGNIFNAPLAPEAGSQEFRDAMESKILPALYKFNPELILISAGFDAHHNDPLSSINLYENDYTWITEKLCQVAGEKCNGRIISSLEGGYDVDALANSTIAHIKSLMDA